MINIAFAPDDNYIMPTSVAMVSLLKNTTTDVCFYILYIENHLSKRNIELLEKIAWEYHALLKPVEVPKSLMIGFPILRHGLSAYLRILSPTLLSDIDKLLYLDGDIVVDKDIQEVYNLDIADYQLAAVADLKPLFAPEYLQTIGFTYDRNYINTGVLLMNLSSLRKINLPQLAQTYLKKYGDYICHSDQDIMNCVCPKIYLIAPKYNSIIHLFLRKNIPLCQQLWSNTEIEEAKQNPVVIHYLGGLKPWLHVVVHPFKKKWYHYLSYTPFHAYRPKDVSVRNRLSHIKAMLMTRFNK